MKFVLPEMDTLVDLLRLRGETQAEQVCYTYLLDGEDQEYNLTYADFERKARQIAVALQEGCRVGDRALLIFRPGIDFILGYFGCLFAGVIAVPVYPPAKPADWQRFMGIAQDCQPSAICSTSNLKAVVQGGLAQFPEFAGLPLVCTDEIDTLSAAEWIAPDIDGNHLAFLQYTSGSTGTPKGVMVSHQNLLHNEKLIHTGFSSRSDFNVVSWLPLYHDMGLIGGAIQPIYLGCRTVILSPVAFLQKPFRWLKAISKYRGNASGGPNFAYDLCVKRINEEQLASLDLSSWEIAFNGAEPIRAGTLARFTEKFAACGFNPNAMYSCYGLAEATLFVTGAKKGEFPTLLNVESEALEKNVLLEVEASHPDAKMLVSSGYVVEQDVRIVHPDSRRECSEFEAGEIWVKGDSVAKGYWNRPDATDDTFNAYLDGSNTGPFLRTGDIGFLYNNQLYVTGRIKELVIIDGRNHYPQDIEDSVQSTLPELRRGCGAAFSVELQGQEKLILVQELERRQDNVDLNGLAQTARRIISENHDLQLHCLVLIEYGSLLKTSSGKIRRRAMRDLFLVSGLKEVFRSELSNVEPPGPTVVAPAPASETQAAQTDLQLSITQLLSPHVGLAPHQIDIQLPFSHFGLDSRALVGLSGEVEEKLGRPMPPHLFYNYPTVAALAAYLAGEEQSLLLQRKTMPDNDGIAIIGMACRFPGQADSTDQFWQLLLANRDAISEVPESRWDAQSYYDPDPTQPGKMNTRWGGFLEHVARFDAEFFGISPREASHMDPQQRILLETSWEALEHALVVPLRVAGSQTGVFIGLSANDYGRLQSSVSSGYAGAGNAFSIAANRLSYFYDWHGPSVVVDTACSSSLVAVHQACNSLLQGECNLALAGAANLILAPEVTVSFSQNRMMAPDGRCKTFDESADGYVRSEGAGMLVLKRLADAKRDGDPILAVIRGSAVNQDGKTNGLTAPNGIAQEAVIRSALAAAGCRPEQVQYVECHGTGTKLGDPIEVYALQKVYGQGRSPRDPLLLGAVKSNIGHLEAAAGMAGLIKAVLSLNHACIPANLHCTKPNSQIKWEESGVTPVFKNISMPQLEWAGVSSFGFGGTNAHVILQKSAEQASSLSQSPSTLANLICLSARDSVALQRQQVRYQSYLANPQLEWNSVCAAVNRGRQHFSERIAVVADNAPAAAGILAAEPIRRKLRDLQKARKVAFMFTGQGSQYLNMGRSLYQSNQLFRTTMDAINALSVKELEHPLLAVIYPAAENSEMMEQLINRTDYTQPALFAVEYALAQCWLEAGIAPNVVLGHSLGEFTAACIAGVFSLEDAFRLVCARGRLMQGLQDPGAMMAVFAHENDVKAYLDAYSEEVSIGAFNGPGQIVLSGKQKALNLLAQEFEKVGIQTKLLRVSHGFHSPLMQPMMQAFSEVAKQICYQMPTIPILSNVTGKLEQSIVSNAGYWCAHVLSPVHFSQSMQLIEKEAVNLIVEVGPKPTLIDMAKRCLPVADIVWLPSMEEGRDNWNSLLTSLGQAYCEGLNLNFSVLNPEPIRLVPALPSYPFADTEFWLESDAANLMPATVLPRKDKNREHHPLLGRRLFSPRMKSEEYLFESEVEIPGRNFLQLAEKAATSRMNLLCFIELCAAAHQAIFGSHEIYLRNIQLQDFNLPDKQPLHQQQTYCSQFIGNELSLNAYLMEAPTQGAQPAWQEIGTALLSRRLAITQQSVESLNRLRTRFRKELDIEDYFESTRESGLKYCNADTPSLTRLWWSPNEALAEVKYRTEQDDPISGVRLRHSLIQACTQTLGAVCPRDGKGTYLPQAIDSVALFADQNDSGWIHIALRPHTVDHLPVADITVYDSIGSVVGIFHGIRLAAMPITRSLIQELKEADANARLNLIETLLEKHVNRVLKSTAPLARNAAFTELGLDSVMAMDIQARIERKLGVSLNPTQFQRGATLQSLSRLVSDLFAQRYYLSGSSATGTGEETSPLVEISAGDADKPPLFFVHPVGGSVFRYYDIAHYLGGQHPFYGLQSPGISGINIEFDTVEEMARYYLSAIRKRQPHGPYLLGGWSMGGIIAFEIAQQLYMQGEDVKLLAIVDAIAPTDKRSGIPVNDHVLVLKLLALDLGIAERNLDIGYLSTLNEDDGLDYIYATAVASEALPASFSYREFKKRTALFRRNYSALNNYVAKPYSGSAHIFKAEVPFRDRRSLSAALDWDEVVAEIAQVKTLPGDHFTLMHRSHVNILATYLRAALKNVAPKAIEAGELDTLPEKYPRSVQDTVINNLCKKAEGCTANLIVDESHSYFFDHPLDHVSGILLIEAMSQLLERSMPGYRSQNAYIKHAKFMFNRFCEKHLATQILIEKAQSQARWNLVNLAAKQAGHTVCSARLAIASNGLPKAGSAEIMRVNLADARHLHKVNPDNVLISTPEPVDEASFICRALPPVGKHILTSGDPVVLPVLYWFEVARQFITYLSHDYYGVPFGSPMNLVSVEFSLTMPLTRGMNYNLVHQVAEKNSLSFKNFAHFEIKIQQGDDVVGKVSLVAQVLDKETYQELRYSEKQSTKL